MAHIPHPSWQPLLFRQVCLLAAVAGVLCFRYPLEGVVAVVLLAFLALPIRVLHAPFRAMPALAYPAKKIVFFAFFFAAGFAFAGVTNRAPLPHAKIPQWVLAAVTPDGKESDPSYTKGVALEGVIVEATRLSGNRVRLLLGNVRATAQQEPLPGLLVLTWQNPLPDIAGSGPGQRLLTTLRLRKIRGFANPGTWEAESYWNGRGAYFRAWARDGGTKNGASAPYVLEGEPSLAWKIRNALHEKVVAALGVGAADGKRPIMAQRAAIIPALLFGDRSFCSPETLDLVAKATLAHSLALSGMHLGFAAGIGYAASYLLSFIFPALFLYFPRQKMGLLLAFPVCAVYLWLGGAPPSLVRAALMLFFWGALLWMNRPKVLIDGLVWAVGIILIFSPAALYDIRLQLSAISVAGIALASPFIEYFSRVMRVGKGRLNGVSPVNRGERALRRMALVVVGMAGVSIAAQAAVLPLVLNAFPGTGGWFPLNLLWLPILGMWVMPFAFAGLFVTALGFTGVASFLFTFAELPCGGLLALLEWMNATGVLVSPVALRPAWVAVAGYWLLLLLLPIIYMGKGFSRCTFGLLFLGLFLITGPTILSGGIRQDDFVSVQLLDVGQGQAVVVSWREKESEGRALIDGGGFASVTFDVGRQVVAPVLTDNAPPKLEYIINSHPDADHLQGLLFPMQTFRVGQVVFGQAELGKITQTVQRRDCILAQKKITPRIVSRGDTIILAPEITLEVLHPGVDSRDLSANNSALVLRLVWRGKPLALICGDLERLGIGQLLKNNVALSAEVMILPHHGSASSLSLELYDATRPQLALASCGYANPWHFPAKSVTQALAERGIPLATTADKGQIRVTWKKGRDMDVVYAR